MGDDQQQPQSISDLANQLFGDLAHEIDIPDEDEHTESTKTPSPSRDGASSHGGAQSERSERSEPVLPERVADVPPAAGIRLLQQRRKERAEASREESRGSTEQLETKDESEELVKLWMKQRW